MIFSVDSAWSFRRKMHESSLDDTEWAETMTRIDICLRVYTDGSTKYLLLSYWGNWDHPSFFARRHAPDNRLSLVSWKSAVVAEACGLHYRINDAIPNICVIVIFHDTWNKEQTKWIRSIPNCPCEIDKHNLCFVAKKKVSMLSEFGFECVAGCGLLDLLCRGHLGLEGFFVCFFPKGH